MAILLHWWMKKLCCFSVSLFELEARGKPYGYCCDLIGRGPGDCLHKCRARLKVLHGGERKMQSQMPSATSLKNCSHRPSPERSSSLLRAMSTSRTCTVQLKLGAKRSNHALRSALLGTPQNRYKTRNVLGFSEGAAGSHSAAVPVLLGDLALFV